MTAEQCADVDAEQEADVDEDEDLGVATLLDEEEETYEGVDGEVAVVERGAPEHLWTRLLRKLPLAALLGCFCLLSLTVALHLLGIAPRY